MDGVITRGVVFLAELRQLSTTGAFLNIWKIEEVYLVNGDRNLPGSHDKVDNDITRKAGKSIHSSRRNCVTRQTQPQELTISTCPGQNYKIVLHRILCVSPFIGYDNGNSQR